MIRANLLLHKEYVHMTMMSTRCLKTRNRLKPFLSLVFYACFLLLPAITYHLAHGTTHVADVKNPAEPVNGTVTLGIEHTLTIDPTKNNAKEDLFFDDYRSHPNGNVYLVDGKNAGVHIFTPAGTYVKSFLRKGSGPAEVQPYPILMITEKTIWVKSLQKVATFDLEGNFLNERRFKEYYYSFQPLTPLKILASVEKNTKSMAQFHKIVSLYDIGKTNRDTVTEVKRLLEVKQGGKVMIQIRKRPMSVYLETGVIPDIIVNVNYKTKRIIAAKNHEYKIYIYDFDGKLLKIIQKKHKNAPLTNDSKVTIARAVAYGQPKSVVSSIVEKIPDSMCAMERIQMTHTGHLIVKSISAYKKTAYDVFDTHGKYLYRVKLPAALDEMTRIRFINNGIACIEEADDTNIYHQFRINAPLGVF